MATGERPFRGDTAASTISSILRDTPRPIAELRPSVPRELAKIIRRCLAKEPTRRYQDSLDVRNELEELKQEMDSGALEEAAIATSAGVSKRFLLGAVGAALVASAMTTYLALGPPRDSERTGLRGSFTQITSLPGDELFSSLSPDGCDVAFASQAAGN